LVGKCVVVAKPQKSCGAAGEQSMPEVAWRDARVDFDLVPVAYRGSLAFDVTNVDISGDFGIAAVCGWPIVGARLCGALNGALDSMRKKIAAEVRSSLNDDEVKRGVAAAVRDYLDKTAEVSILGVKRVAMEDGVLRVGLGLRY
jgi:hypothetical protein